MTSILGISAYYHDSSAAIIINDEIIAAVQEERFTRLKHDNSFPFNSIIYVLSEANMKLSEIDYIVFYEKPFLKFERLLETHIAFAPKGLVSFCASIPVWLKEKLFQKKLIIDNLKKIDENFSDYKKLKFSEHHLSHAASAFFPSSFKDAIVITLDGVGEWATTTIGIGNQNKLEIMEEIHFPHSLGLLYSAFTYFLGFKVNSGEYKVMGLAPFGSPKYKDIIINKILDLKDDGSFRLRMKYFDYATGLKMTNNNFSKLFGKNVRKSDEPLEQFHADIASSIQFVIEEIIVKIAKYTKQKYKLKNLCLAGGVALNCVANGKILEKKLFENIWIQPAAGDAGGALGAALAFNYIELCRDREIKQNQMKGSYLGPKYNDEEIEKELILNEARYIKLSEEDLIIEVCKQLSNNKAIGWFQGRMEYGPRALGNRSIIADPRNNDMQKNLNLKVKFRESFRPFAPAVLQEKVQNYFNLECDSPYMLLVSKINEKIKRKFQNEIEFKKVTDKINQIRSSIPAVTHVDYSARIQTVHEETNKKFYDLIKMYDQLYSCPVLINTSFNIRGEPIVNTPTDAFRCFMGTNLDVLVIENFILNKKEQKKALFKNYKNKFKLD